MQETRVGEIEQLLEFVVEIEKLKAVLRKTRPVGLERRENSAEHSWHVCLTALMFREYANEPVDIDRVIRMLLIHDLGEIDAGDKIVYASETAEQKAAEAAGVQRVLALVPGGRGEELFALWQEFEAGETAESRYARAIDRVPPLLHNLRGGGHAWKENKIPKEKVFALNSRIGDGSRELWQVIEEQLQGAVASGLLE
ncbi:HD domain-containing protein [Microbulbifer marinus]|uniref:Putative hydrolases of HD superfamily n=1 Tax=Microbulbifer marinus TaxID=658218 RepID=A0A1H3XAL1_9GAMM|nr:HD domain-containing protein [Microbulbifer marinus]SDZ95662.1 putative hydrolases of HD superfamily [Microbulbifer marinus]